jgi:hypothetical protein
MRKKQLEKAILNLGHENNLRAKAKEFTRILGEFSDITHVKCDENGKLIPFSKEKKNGK